MVVGLTLADGKRILAAPQHHLVRVLSAYWLRVFWLGVFACKSLKSRHLAPAT
jgi:hypothetical protein